MIAMTTSNSISVKARFPAGRSRRLRAACMEHLVSSTIIIIGVGVERRNEKSGDFQFAKRAGTPNNRLMFKRDRTWIVKAGSRIGLRSWHDALNICP
jgi:hypothetical protein